MGALRVFINCDGNWEILQICLPRLFTMSLQQRNLFASGREVMNKDSQVQETINSIVVDALEQMKTLKAEDRYNRLCELGEWIFCDPEEEEILLVPSNYSA